MRVITTSGSRTVKFVLRELQTATTSYKAILTNENTGVETEIDVVDWTVTQMNNNNGQLSVNITDTFNEGADFSVKITSVDKTVVYHRNKLFVTDQTPQDYSING